MSEKLFLRMLRREPCRRVPVWLMRQAGRYLPEYREVRAQAGDFLALCYTPELAAEVTLQPVRRFALDAAIIFSDILVVPQALGCTVRFEEGAGPVLEPVVRAEALREAGDPAFRTALAPVYEAIRRVRSALPPDVALIGFAGAPWTLATYMVEGGTSRDHAAVKRLAYADPEAFDRLIARLAEAVVEHLVAQAEAGAEALQLFDTWAGVLPAPLMRRWCLAPARAIMAALRARAPGVPLIAFPRGVGAGYAEYAAAGFDALSIDTAVPVGWAAQALQPRTVVQGNLDPLLLVAGGRAMTEGAGHILRALAAGPHVFNLGHGIVPATPPAHVAALAELVRDFRRA